MDKFALWLRGNTRVLIVGLLAWTLVLHGMGAATLSHAVDLGVGSADFGHCAAPDGADDHRRSPGPHFSCSCCIPCRAGQIDGPTGVLSLIPKGADLSFPALAIAPVGVSPIVEISSPPGWTSSWSQRAPPIA
jgi:hypothetical protein